MYKEGDAQDFCLTTGLYHCLPFFQTFFKKWVAAFLKTHNFFTKNKFGFTEYSSTEEALLEFLEQIYNHKK